MFARSWTLGELLVAAQVEVLAELALRALEVARQVREVALLVAPLGLGHRGAVLLELRLQVAHLLGELLDLGVARRELLLELLLRALGGRRLAEQALGVDEADLVVGRLRRRPAPQRQQGEGRDGGDARASANSCCDSSESRCALAAANCGVGAAQNTVPDLELEALDLVAAARR